ncbi:MAG: hypothetical protein LRY55_06745 [Leadbetterella sp.]|nr:hypothetical protein [Leadbetterella sp.]
MKGLFGGLVCLFFLANATAQTSNAKIYDGKEYVTGNTLVSGTPFYRNADHQENNSLLFDKVLYSGVPLLYDLKTDQLITRRPGEGINMIVVKEMVELFTVGKDTIVHLKEAGTGLADGFYLRVFDSPLYKSVARYKKTVKDPRSVNEKRYYEESVEYFIKTPATDTFVPLKSTAKLLSTDKKHKKNLKSLLRTHGMENSENFPAKIALVLDYLNKANTASI